MATKQNATSKTNGAPREISGLELILLTLSPGQINQLTVERLQSRAFPDEPEELRIWRVVLDYANELRKSIRYCEVDGPRWARRFRRQCFVHTKGDKLAAAKVEKQVLAAFEGVRAECAEVLDELHRDIESRPAKAPWPRAILQKVLGPRLGYAVRAVEIYLEKIDLANTPAERARLREDVWMTLSIVSKKAPIRYASIDDLVAEGRKWRDSSSRSRGRLTVARYVVAKVAGLTPDSRALR